VTAVTTKNQGQTHILRMNAQPSADPDLDPLLHAFRGHRVILDADLARLYGVTTSILNQAVKRHPERFPSDFAFQIIPEEMEILRQSLPVLASANDDIKSTNRSRAVIGSSENGEFSEKTTGMRSHPVIASPDNPQIKRNQRYLPWAFTEHGALMAATILRSPRAVQMSLYVVRAFVKLRQVVMKNKDLTRCMAEAELALREHDTILADVYDKLEPLLDPPPEPAPKRTLGFRKEDR
jgi:hypothetical protein